MKHLNRSIMVSVAVALASVAGVAQAQTTQTTQTVETTRSTYQTPPAPTYTTERPPTPAYSEEEDITYVEPAPPPRHMFFLEATGAYGIQFGDTPYLPSGGPTDYQHPIVHGFGVGGTAGVYVIPDTLAIIANYEYDRSISREGVLTGVLDEVQGLIQYHTAMLGLRLRVPVGFGAIRAEVSGGVLFPFQTELSYQYGAGLSQLPTPITGTGTRTDFYSVGFGGSGLIGYEMPLFGPLYLAINIRLRTFQTENSGERTELRNFVTDFTALPPTATDGTVTYGNGAARPSTYSVQDARLQLAIGAAF